jgi:heat-inducible transcriptional repressor
MADLEDLGYLLQPHTSAGRVPTEKAYRLYVESVLQHLRELPPSFSLPDKLAAGVEDRRRMLQDTSKLLSNLSHYAGLVLAPDANTTVFERIEIIRLRRDHLLVLLVSSDGVIENRIIPVDEDYTDDDLQRITRLLNDKLGGLDLAEVRRLLIDEMRADKALYDRLLKRALDLAQKAVQPQSETELYLGGTANILDLPEFADVDRMKAIFRAFEEKATIVQLLNKCLDTDGVQVYIGSETGFSGVEGCSLVLSSYKKGGQALGSLGVIGPIRMDYDRVIPLVDQTAKAISRLLEHE